MAHLVIEHILLLITMLLVDILKNFWCLFVDKYNNNYSDFFCSKNFVVLEIGAMQEECGSSIVYSSLEISHGPLPSWRKHRVFPETPVDACLKNTRNLDDYSEAKSKRWSGTTNEQLHGKVLRSITSNLGMSVHDLSKKHDIAQRTMMAQWHFSRILGIATSTMMHIAHFTGILQD